MATGLSSRLSFGPQPQKCSVWEIQELETDNVQGIKNGN